MGETNKRYFAVHAFTLIGLALTIVLLLWANLHLRILNEQIRTRGAVSHALRDEGWGWPFGWQQRSQWEYDLSTLQKLSGWDHDNFNVANIEWLPFAGDFAIATVIVVFVIFVCEWFCRRKNARFINFKKISFAVPSKKRVGVVFLSLPLIAIGGFLIYLAIEDLIRELTIKLPWDYWLELYMENKPGYPTFETAQPVEYLAQYVKGQISAMFLIGYLILATGLLMLAKRFSLRVLLLTVLLGGTIACIPSMLNRPRLSPGQEVCANGSLRLGIPISKAQVSAIEANLQPSIALALFPKDLKKQTGLEQLEIVRQITFSERLTGYGTQVLEMKLLLHSDLTESQVDTLVAFYWWYVKALAYQAAYGNSQPPKPSSTYSLSSLWNAKWQAECERALNHKN